MEASPRRSRTVSRPARTISWPARTRTTSAGPSASRGRSRGWTRTAWTCWALDARVQRHGPARDGPPAHQAAPARADRALPAPPQPLPPPLGGAAALGGARGGRLSGSRPAGGLLAVGADDAGRGPDGEPARGAGG